VDFLNFEYSTVQGRKWHDENANGQRR
jgi:hypothetical protein